MKSTFEQMREQQEAATAKGEEIKSWTIRTEFWPDVEREARDAGSLDGKSILGAPFEVSDRAGSEDGYLFTVTGKPAGPS